VRINPQALREAREAAGINRSELSRRAGFKSRNYAHRLEDGARGSNVSAETLEGLSKALGVEPGALLLEDPPDVPSATSEEPDAPEPAATVTGDPHPEAWRWG
jgi:transcriptional regulator with XRE-family HTH domain